jgi:uncharacterized surface protein with fasciclin (FAS1) repeats
LATTFLINNVTINVTQIQTVNGVVYIINEVLIPPNVTVPNVTPAPPPVQQTLVQRIAAFSNLSVLLAVAEPDRTEHDTSGCRTVYRLWPDEPGVYECHAEPDRECDRQPLERSERDGRPPLPRGAGQIQCLGPAERHVATDRAGANITVNVTGNQIILNNNSTANATAFNATNGVLYTINQVLIPPTVTPNVTAARPTVNITAPQEGANLTAPNVTVTVNVTNFTLVEPRGQANATNQGHLHFYRDVRVPTTPGQPAVIPNDTMLWALTANTTYTWTNLTPGAHNFSVQLVNNDHTPLSPPVLDTVNVTVSPVTPNVTPNVTPVQQTLVQRIAAFSNLSVLSQSLNRTGLNATLQGAGPFTVFGPTNQAFTNATQNLTGNATGNLSNVVNVTDVLLYHVVPGRYNVSDLRNVTSLRTVQGANISVNVTGNRIILNNNSTANATAFNATNGVLYTINQVLIPPTVTPNVTAARPTVNITAPQEGANLTAPNVTVTVNVTNFTLVEPRGQANATNQGHLHFYRDVRVPTTPGQPAVIPNDTMLWALTANTTYTWTNLTPGAHNFSVQLVNNDHTPLSPPVLDTVNVTVSPVTPNVTPNVTHRT